MTERDNLLFYLTRLSDKRIHRLMSFARANYAVQKADEPITLTEKARCADALAELDAASASRVYRFTKFAIEGGDTTETEQLRKSIHDLAEKVKSPSVLHRVYMILTRAYNNWE